MVEKIRRVVTGHDVNGKSIFVEDGIVTSVKEMDQFRHRGESCSECSRYPENLTVFDSAPFIRDLNIQITDAIIIKNPKTPKI